jgi:hypothetical protein
MPLSDPRAQVCGPLLRFLLSTGHKHAYALADRAPCLRQFRHRTRRTETPVVACRSSYAGLQRLKG